MSSSLWCRGGCRSLYHSFPRQSVTGRIRMCDLNPRQVEQGHPPGCSCISLCQLEVWFGDTLGKVRATYSGLWNWKAGSVAPFPPLAVAESHLQGGMRVVECQVPSSQVALVRDVPLSKAIQSECWKWKGCSWTFLPFQKKQQLCFVKTLKEKKMQPSWKIHNREKLL